MKYRQIIFPCLLLVYAYSLSGQSITYVYPQTVRIASDTLRVKFSNLSKVIPLIVRNDTVDMGTDGAIGMTATIYHDRDSTVIGYNNLPFGEIYFIPIATPSKTAIYRLHFNPVSASFTAPYIEQNWGKSQFEIPEVYELANIIWTLSPSGERATNLYKEGAYHEKVLAHFGPFAGHPVFKSLDVPDSLYFSTYYDFRENSLAYQFRGDDLVAEGPYFYVRGNDWTTHNSLFRKLIPLVEDFAAKSGYRAFYEENKSFYASQVRREQELMPVNEMWEWLEVEFPDIKYQSYKVVFSPLIGSSHSTQNFATFSNNKWFRESVMFVCGPAAYDNRLNLTEQQKQGLMSGIVFTEIDHNYVNRTSFRYSAKIDSIFSVRSKWTAVEGDNANYTNPMAVFNEYMTHAIFCLWVSERYSKHVADFIINSRRTLMEERRGFTRFGEFYLALEKLRKAEPEQTVSDLFPEIIDWCGLQY